MGLYYPWQGFGGRTRMARISEEKLSSLKQDISLQRLAESRGIVLKPHGKDLVGLCPFHDDKEPFPGD